MNVNDLEEMRRITTMFATAEGRTEEECDAFMQGVRAITDNDEVLSVLQATLNQDTELELQEDEDSFHREWCDFCQKSYSDKYGRCPDCNLAKGA